MLQEVSDDSNDSLFGEDDTLGEEACLLHSPAPATPGPATPGPAQHTQPKQFTNPDTDTDSTSQRRANALNLFCDGDSDVRRLM